MHAEGMCTKYRLRGALNNAHAITTKPVRRNNAAASHHGLLARQVNMCDVEV